MPVEVLTQALAATASGLEPGKDSIDDLLVYCTVGVVVGGRLGQVLLWSPGYYLAHPLEAAMIWRGGMSFHGGMIGVLVATLLFAWRHKTPWLTVLDLVCLAGFLRLLTGEFIRAFPERILNIHPQNAPCIR